MSRRMSALLLGIALLVLVSVPVLAGTGNGKENAPGQQKEKTPKAPITLTGTIQSAAGENGKTEYTLADGGKTYSLSAGPK